MIKKELREFITYNEFNSNISLSALVFFVIVFIKSIAKSSLTIDLTTPFILFVISFAAFSLIDYLKRKDFIRTQ